MDLALAGKTIAIAGSSAGIGAAVTASLDREHARLLLVGGRSERLSALADTLSPGALIGIVPGDLRRESERNRCTGALLGSVELDGFVFLPAELRTDSFVEARSCEFRETFDVNVFAAFEFAQAALSKASSLASFVFVSSIDAHRHPRHTPSASYDSSKRALESISESIAVEAGSRGIRSNCIIPGLIRTPMTEGFFGQEFEAERLQFLDAVPLGRPGNPEDVANLITFLLSPVAGYVNGTSIPVDGGFLCQGL
jgi:meso-butanediol dehydrogenase/(S,S)-butanediol dehydrogenase/diacetyl reductase